MIREDIKNIIRTEVKNKYDRPTNAAVRRVGAPNRIDIDIGGGSVLHDVTVIGNATNFVIGQRVPLVWINQNGFERPVAVGVGPNTPNVDESIFYLNENGKYTLRPGAIQPHHLNFTIATNPAVGNAIVYIGEEEPTTMYPGMLWLEP